MRSSLRCPSCGYDLCGQVAALDFSERAALAPEQPGAAARGSRALRRGPTQPRAPGSGGMRLKEGLGEGVCAECGSAFRLAVETEAAARPLGRSRWVGILIFLNALSLSVYFAGGDALAVVLWRALPVSAGVVLGAIGLTVAAFGGPACWRAACELMRPSGRGRRAARVFRFCTRASAACGVMISGVCVAGFALWSSASFGAGEAAAACAAPALTGAAFALISGACGRAVRERGGSGRSRKRERRTNRRIRLAA